MRDFMIWLDRPISPALAALILLAFWIAGDVAIVGVAIWIARGRRLRAWVADLIFGAEDCRAGEKQIPFFAYVPMPEGNYLSKITFRPYTYRRRRWFATRVLRAHVVMQNPIPIPPPAAIDAKGARRRVTEDQAIYFVMVPNAPTIEAAALYVREYALNLRAKFVFGEDADSKLMRANAQN